MSDNEQETSQSIKERLADAARAEQEPADRIWAVIYSIAVVVLILGGLVIEQRLYLSDSTSTSRELGFERGSVDCLSVIVDNDRNFDLPQYCGRSEIVVYYPEEVCEVFFPSVNECGINRRGG